MPRMPAKKHPLNRAMADPKDRKELVQIVREALWDEWNFGSGDQLLLDDLKLLDSPEVLNFSPHLIKAILKTEVYIEKNYDQITRRMVFKATIKRNT